MPKQFPQPPSGPPREPAGTTRPDVTLPQSPTTGATPPPGPKAGAAPTRLVLCAKLGKELPGLPAPPFPTPLGERIFTSISQPAWSEWLQHSQRVVNERGLNLADAGARAAWMQECETFLFGGGAPPPPGWVPPGGFVRLDIKKGKDEE